MNINDVELICYEEIYYDLSNNIVSDTRISCVHLHKKSKQNHLVSIVMSNEH